jgi:hypothetical protein
MNLYQIVLFLSAIEGSGSHVFLVSPVQYMSESIPEAYKMYYFSKSRGWPHAQAGLFRSKGTSVRIRYVVGGHQNVSEHGDEQQNISALDSNRLNRRR